ncbi:hypothetical protein SNT98_002872 [Salmonella enterica]|nr:hypothetical protein [Salmonella enterica]EHA0310172.1 hypothetical protein [Salmonella enterica]EII3723400.1 hypothetical protein [Salmonella enterica]EJX1403798.1 hypothetical protein [Salmonella enterica]ELG2881989.1 hypothetical protein [Salmonella enterica]
MISILMNIELAKHVRDINLKDDVGDIIVKFSCETPLNEMDTCDMFTFHFGNIYYEVSDEDYFIRKGPLSEMGGNMRLEVSEKNLCLKAGDSVLIPIACDLEDEIKKGIYNPDNDTSIRTLVERNFGDLFDSNGDFICK